MSGKPAPRDDGPDLAQHWSRERGFFMVPNEVWDALCDSPIDFAVWCELRRRARWEPGFANGSNGTVWLERGQALFGREELAASIGFRNRVGAIRGALLRHQASRRLAIKVTSQGSIATFPDYGEIEEPAPSKSPADSPRPSQGSASGSASDQPVDKPLTKTKQAKTKHGTRNIPERESGAPLSPPMSKAEEEAAWDVVRILFRYTGGNWSSKGERERITELIRSGTPAEHLKCLIAYTCDSGGLNYMLKENREGEQYMRHMCTPFGIFADKHLRMYITTAISEGAWMLCDINWRASFWSKPAAAGAA